ncbi:PREDICTED: uncharacterized protein LOC109582878 [Amphimedon queenslandica]|uniref:Spindle and centriole-associated protein 1 n=1 Tax=Amphimedon queenslandica TaxID=400682 RepID=A0A1X7ULT5_AMPQE|nr:PREDICTED: uncharacterized protein LOC109582878 [Amphimedon queenslandica]|eukprot:XP_019853476.1 PREDICTED: uncharacterized protein LOC109582878 [Amphimedon queenslandica]
MAAKLKNKKRNPPGSGWDNSVTDLSAYRLTPAELERRKASHVSKNLEAARKELYETPRIKSKDSLLLDSSNQISDDDQSQNSPPKQHLLIKAKCVQGQPNITLAPHILTNKENMERTLLEAQTNQPTAVSSPGGIHDNTLRRPDDPPTVLNEVIGDQESPDEDSPDKPNPLYQSLVDVKQYQDYIQREATLDSVSMSIRKLQLDMEELGQEMGVVTDAPRTQGGSLESVVNTCTCLMEYLKEAQRQLKEERTLQEQLLMTVEEQQGLMDTMAMDILKLREEQIKMEKENKKIKEQYSNLEVKVNELERQTKVPPQFMPVMIPGPRPPISTTPTYKSSNN